MLSGYEISRAAAQAGVAAEDIPSLLRHLGVGPGGFRRAGTPRPTIPKVRKPSMYSYHSSDLDDLPGVNVWTRQLPDWAPLQHRFPRTPKTLVVLIFIFIVISWKGLSKIPFSLWLDGRLRKCIKNDVRRTKKKGLRG